MGALKILQHLIIYLAFEIHIIWYQPVTTQHTLTLVTHFKCPTMARRKMKRKEEHRDYDELCCQSPCLRQMINR